MAKHAQNRHNQPRVFHYGYRRKIGLLGGSFNPAHEGHVALSEKVRRTIKCDEIWWLVSPQNPLKSSDDMADFERRLSYARALVANKPFIKVIRLEQDIGTRFSYDSVRYIKSRAPHAQFYWLIGTDNLCQLPHWHKAKAFTRLVPFIAVRRKDSFYQAVASKGRAQFRCHNRIKQTPYLRILSDFHAPQSATSLRKSGFWQSQT